MDLAQRMARLFDQSAGCTALVFGDAETGTVLRACAAPGQRQEDHDALLAEGAALLGTRGAAYLAAARTGVQHAPEAPAPRPLAVTVARPNETRLFARSDDGLPDMLCARCRPDMPAADLREFHSRLAEFVRGAGDG